MQVTQHDIAREAGVSRSLVSMALNDSGRVDAKTRQRILAAARKLGYRRNLIGKTMRTGQSMTVGVLIRVPDQYFSQMLTGVQETLQKNGYVPITLSVGGEFELLEQVRRLLEQRVDGIIIKPESQIYEKSIRDILRFKVPLVTVDSFIQGAMNVDFSGVNDDQLGLFAAEHLLDLGHRNVSVVVIKEDLHLARRAASFKHRIEASGGKAEIIVADAYEDFSWETVFFNNPTSGIFFMSDLMAAQFMVDAQAAGFNIPEDLSVMAVGNLDLSTFCNPPLTTFEQHSYNIGANAVKMLLDRMSGELDFNASQRQMLETATLVKRASTAPPSR